MKKMLLKNWFWIIILIVLGIKYGTAQEVVHTSDAGYTVTKVSKYGYLFTFDGQAKPGERMEEFFFTGYVFNEEQFTELISTIDSMIIEYQDALKKSKKDAKAIITDSAHVGWNYITRYKDVIHVNLNLSKVEQYKRNKEMITVGQSIRKAQLEFVEWVANYNKQQ